MTDTWVVRVSEVVVWEEVREFASRGDASWWMAREGTTDGREEIEAGHSRTTRVLRRSASITGPEEGLAAPPKPSKKELAVLRILVLNPGISAKEWGEKAKVSRAAGYRWAQRMAADGKVLQLPDGGYELTDEGRALVGVRPSALAGAGEACGESSGDPEADDER